MFQPLLGEDDAILFQISTKTIHHPGKVRQFWILPFHKSLPKPQPSLLEVWLWCGFSGTGCWVHWLWDHRYRLSSWTFEELDAASCCPNWATPGGAWRVELTELLNENGPTGFYTCRIIPFGKWLGSPPFISYEKAIWKENNPILRGQKLTNVINHLQVMGWSSKYGEGGGWPWTILGNP